MAVLILLALGWGILFGLVWGRIGFPVLSVLTVLILAISVCLFSIAWTYQSKNLAACCCFLVGLMLGWMLWQNSLVPNEYESLYGQKINMTATVVERPTVTESGNQALILRPDGFDQLVRASLFHHAYVKTGDQVWLKGELKQPENFEGFDYVNYLKQKNIYAELSKARMLVMGQANISVSAWLDTVRQSVVRRAGLLLSETAAAIVLGMLIGERDALPGNIEEAFKKTGLIHVLVVSGFNLTLIASGIGITARVVGRKGSDYSSLIVIWLFVILVGAGSAVVRAGVMASIIILARLFGRLAISQVSLLFAVVIMGVLNPLQLFHDIGFQLSVVATWGVLQANRLRVVYERDSWLSELVWPSIGAILATAPVVAYYFGTLSLIAPLANLLVLPLIPYVMLLGVLAMLPLLQTIFVPLVEAVISLQLKVTAILADWQYSQIPMSLHPSLMISYYAMLVVGAFWLQNQRSMRLKKYRVNDTITKIII